MYLNYKDASLFHQQGFVIVPNVFTPEEVDRMSEAVSGARVANHTTSMLDTTGLTTKLAIWFEIGDDLWSAVTTCPRLVNPLRILMGEEIAFFHGKVIFKEAKQAVPGNGIRITATGTTRDLLFRGWSARPSPSIRRREPTVAWRYCAARTASGE